MAHFCLELLKVALAVLACTIHTLVVGFSGETVPTLGELLITASSFIMKGQLWPLYNVDSKDTSVSGLSSGGYMSAYFAFLKL